MATTKQPVTPVTSTQTNIAGADAVPTTIPPVSSTATSEAKSRFSAALDEAKAGAAVLVDEAKARATSGRKDAVAAGEDWSADAKTKAGELAVEGKHQASEALASLSGMIEENAAKLDAKFGVKYGDYARTASNSLRDTAKTLEEKSYEELGEDARQVIRKSPAAAVGIAALAGFFVSRIFRK